MVAWSIVDDLHQGCITVMVVVMDWLLGSKTGQILVLFGGLFLARHFIRQYLVILIRRAVRSSSHETEDQQQKRIDTLVNVIGALLTIGLVTIGFFGLLMIMSVNIAGFLAGLGAAGVLFGLVGQSLIKDVMAGFFIIMENQYRVGDVVTLGSVTGTVESVSLRITRLRDFSGDMHVVPNGAVEVITNKTYQWSNVIVDIGVGYDSDILKVEEILNKVGDEMLEDDELKLHILEPIGFLRVDSFGDSAVVVKSIGRVQPGSQWEVAGAYRERVKAAFDENGIEIPFPQRVVHSAISKPKAKK